jgi:hypothetical protein
MATLQKARVEDFDAVHELLLDFNNPGISKEHWRKALITPWKTDEDYWGYLLRDDRQVVGFLGLLFANRSVKGADERFCNMTAWIVKKAYRAESLSLAYPVMELENYTLTNFTSSPNVDQILRTLGFAEIDCKYRVLLPLPTFNSFKIRGPGFQILFDQASIQGALREPELRIYQDHLPYKCRHVLITHGERQCYLLLTIFRRKRIHFAHIHCISDLALFLECVDTVKFMMMAHFRVLAFLVDARLLQDRPVARTKEWPMISHRLVKSDRLGRFDIDGLYSELVTMTL